MSFTKYVIGMNYIWKSDAVRRGGNYFFVFLRHFSSLEDLRNEWWWTSRLKCLGHLELKIGYCNLTHTANLRRRTFIIKLRTITRIYASLVKNFGSHHEFFSLDMFYWYFLGFVHFRNNFCHQKLLTDWPLASKLLGIQIDCTRMSIPSKMITIARRTYSILMILFSFSGKQFFFTWKRISREINVRSNPSRKMGT